MSFLVFLLAEMMPLTSDGEKSSHYPQPKGGIFKNSKQYSPISDYPLITFTVFHLAYFQNFNIPDWQGSGGDILKILWENWTFVQ